MHVGMCGCSCVYRSMLRPEENLGCHSSSTAHLLLDTGSPSLPWNLPTRLDWLVSKSQGSTCPCLSSAGITRACYHAWLLLCARASNSGPQAGGKHFINWAISFVSIVRHHFYVSSSVMLSIFILLGFIGMKARALCTLGKLYYWLLFFAFYFERGSDFPRLALNSFCGPESPVPPYVACVWCVSDYLSCRFTASSWVQ